MENRLMVGDWVCKYEGVVWEDSFVIVEQFYVSIVGFF